METTFITIHDLSPQARILYTSDSIVDILGYSPNEVVNRSCWEFFHPDELPVARAKHGRGIEMDKAAMLSYCRMRNKDGQWLGCEVVHTVVYNVMVCCTSVYRRGLRSQNRAAEAPVVRRLFSNSPKDPRYHMLSHLSSKFMAPPKLEFHEPRAALFLNRYTRTLTIMYATDGLAEVLGISGEELRGRSFYYCIQENCLRDAIKCLENAKANDSIAYLRFWFRNPKQDDVHNTWNSSSDAMDIDGEPEDIRSSDGDQDMTNTDAKNSNLHPSQARDVRSNTQMFSSNSSAALHSQSNGPLDSRTSSGESSNPYTHEAVFGDSIPRSSSVSSISNSPNGDRRRINGHETARSPSEPIELEAVVSCTSDGLVVCLRQARSPLPLQQPAQNNNKSIYSRGLFAVPWSPEPILPPVEQRLHFAQPASFIPNVDTASPQQLRAHTDATNDNQDFMNSIRDIAVFAWALVGINGSLAEYSRGKPSGEAQPPGGLPVWTPEDTQHKSNGFRDGYRYHDTGQSFSAHQNGSQQAPNNATQSSGASAPAPLNFSMPRSMPVANTGMIQSNTYAGNNRHRHHMEHHGR